MILEQMSAFGLLTTAEIRHRRKEFLDVSKRRLELLAFLLGVAGIVACVFNGKEAAQQQKAAPADRTAQSVTLEIPNAPWEPFFFKALQERTNKIGISSLRKSALPDNDLEVRFWYDHFEMISGVIIRRSAGEWSATYLGQRSPKEPLSIQQESLGAPKSGWEAAWKRLRDANILTLPDGSVNCKTEALDGIGYVVETNVNRRYRTYMYGNPSLANCDEAKQIIMIEAILAEEFQIPPPPK
jgi:hypothetical protein